MNNLKKEYIIKRQDLETKDQKIVKKYSKVLKAHNILDLRLNKKKSDLLNINIESINKIFDYLESELPEEHILFLYEKEYDDENIKQNNENIINTSKSNLDEDFEIENENDEKKEFLTLEVENPENVLKKFKTLTYQIMKKYYFIFCILCFIMAILFTIHLFYYLISKEVSINILLFI